MDQLSRHVFDLGIAMAQASMPCCDLDESPTVHMLWLNDHVLGIYHDIARASVVAHRIRQSATYREQRWEKVIDEPHRRQRWACAAVARLEIETRKVD